MKPTKNPAAVALGRLGGSVKSKAKTKAARMNARKPRKKRLAEARKMRWVDAGNGMESAKVKRKYPKRKIAWIQKNDMNENKGRP